MMRVSLFISNFKKYIKRGFGILSPLLFLLLLFGVNRLMRYLICDDSDSYTRLAFHEMRTQEENIDVLFLGSSHCFRSVDVGITDEMFDANTFNSGSALQSWDGSYAILKEAARKNDLQRVYVEMYYDIAGEVYWEREGLTSVYIISDYLSPSFNKARYLMEGSAPDYWIDGFFPARRYWQKLFSKGHIAGTIAAKRTEGYKNYEYWGDPETDQQYYTRKGYIANRETIENYDFSAEGDWEAIPEVIFSEDDKRSLQRIIDYCEKNNIELAFFSVPMPYYNMVATGNYGSYIEQVNDLLEGSGVPYYDFNLCREDYFSYDCALFMDEDHLNSAGAECFSRLFAGLMLGQIEEKDLFYDSYEEKMQSISDRIYGITYRVMETEAQKCFTFETVQKGTLDCYASIYKMTPDMQGYEVLRVLAPLDDICVPVGEQGQLRIDIYTDEQGTELTNQIYIDY